MDLCHGQIRRHNEQSLTSSMDGRERRRLCPLHSVRLHFPWSCSIVDHSLFPLSNDPMISKHF